MQDGGEDVGQCVEKFYIEPLSGMITAKMKLDYEQRAIYKCRVLAVDAGEPPNTGQTLTTCRAVPHIAQSQYQRH